MLHVGEVAFKDMGKYSMITLEIKIHVAFAPHTNKRALDHAAKECCGYFAMMGKSYRGYLQYLLYHVTSPGFVQQSFDALVNAIEQSAVQAHENLKPGSVFINTESTSGKSIGAFSWYASHGTSMSRDNKLISGDNKGAAARFFEDWLTSTESNSSRSVPTPSNISKLIKKVRSIKATGGKPSGNSTSRSFKARKSDRSQFVGAFCQSNVGDVSPNVLGAFCTDSGKPCDFNHSSCHGDVNLCIGRGPGYPDDILSTKIIGERQFNKAVDLLTMASMLIDLDRDTKHSLVKMSHQRALEKSEGPLKRTKPIPGGMPKAQGCFTIKPHKHRANRRADA
ncbi:hypothetical protein NC652_005164 [Populus alba x Populus x berolinensis]|nr:hypothetical protein NC652_005164 [Populus alba x Populus x berolinensis]